MVIEFVKRLCGPGNLGRKTTKRMTHASDATGHGEYVKAEA